MFEFTVSKQDLLTPLLTISGAVDKKQSLVILTNVLFTLTEKHLLITATDLEIEMTARVAITSADHTGALTVSAKKILDIIRSLNDNAIPTFVSEAGNVCIKEGRSQFKLATLSADDYPSSEIAANEVEFSVARQDLIHLLQTTYFSISQQDVRVFLNGLLLEVEERTITAVAMDGHRMAICKLALETKNPRHRFLIPRKGVQEMLRLLNNVTDEHVFLSANQRHFKLATEQYTFLTKLIESRFPAYVKAIPKNQDKQVVIDRDILKRALSRIAILANEKSQAVLLDIQPNQVTLIANNQEQEEAIETLVAETQGEALQIGINAGYLLDVLQHIEEGLLRLSFSTTDTSILVESLQDECYVYILMPMKL